MTRGSKASSPTCFEDTLTAGYAKEPPAYGKGKKTTDALQYCLYLQQAVGDVVLEVPGSEVATLTLTDVFHVVEDIGNISDILAKT